jgi:hypothetical protein
MSPWDDLLDRLTQRLQADPELRREISRELLGHLEDSQAQFGAAGMSEDEAQAAAGKALGDESEVAEQLWQANRHRLRVRRAIKWTAGVTLAPASAVISISMAWGALVSIAVVMGTMGTGSSFIANLTRPIANHFNRNMTNGLSPEAQAVFAANHSEDSAQTLIRAKALADTHPNDPLYYANYVRQFLSEIIVHIGPHETFSAERAQQAIPLLDHGKEVEPNNGFYPLVKAALLFQASSTSIDDVPEESLPGFDYQTAAGKRERWTVWGYRINNPSMFDQALVEMREAAAKPRIDSHATELLERNLESLAPPHSLAEIVWRRQHLTAPFAPSQRLYAIWPVLWRASELARQGDANEARQLVQNCRQIARLVARNSQMVSDLMTARGIYILTFGMEAFIDQQAGDKASFNRTVKAIQDQQASFDRMWRERSEGLNARLSSDAISLADYSYFTMNAPATVDYAPGRRAEYALADRLALSIILLILTSLAAVSGVSAVIVRLRSGQWPTVATIGWRSLARVAFTSALVPTGVYAIYILSPLSARDRAANNSIERLAIEYTTLACCIVALLRILSNQALRKRAMELGAEELKRRRPGRGTLMMGGLLAIVVATYLILTRHGGLPWRVQWLFPLLGSGLIGYLLLWLFGSRAQANSTSRNVTRRFSAPLAWVLIVGFLLIARSALFSYPFARDFAGTIRAVALVLFAVITLGLLVRAILELRRAHPSAPGGAFNYRLSMALPILCTAVVLAIVAGWPLKLEQRRALAEMHSVSMSNSPAHELDRSPWRALKQRIDQSAP